MAVRVYAPKKPLPPAKVPEFLKYEFEQLTKEFGYKAGSIEGCPVVYVDYDAFRFIVKPTVSARWAITSISEKIPVTVIPIIIPEPVVCFVVERDGKAEVKYSSPCLAPADHKWEMSIISVREARRGKIVYRDIPVSQFLAGAASMKITVEEVVSGIERGMALDNILQCFFIHAKDNEEFLAMIDHLQRTINISIEGVLGRAAYGVAHLFKDEDFATNARGLSRLDPDEYTRLNIVYILVERKIPLIENLVSLKDILSLPHIDDYARSKQLTMISSSAVNGSLERYIVSRGYAPEVYYDELSAEIHEIISNRGEGQAVKFLSDELMRAIKYICKRLKIKLDPNEARQVVKREVEWCMKTGVTSGTIEDVFNAIVEYVRSKAYDRIEKELYDVPKMHLDQLFLADDYLAYKVSHHISMMLYGFLYDTIELLKRKFGYKFEISP